MTGLRSTGEASRAVLHCFWHGCRHPLRALGKWSFGRGNDNQKGGGFERRPLAIGLLPAVVILDAGKTPWDALIAVDWRRERSDLSARP